MSIENGAGQRDVLADGFYYFPSAEGSTLLSGMLEHTITVDTTELSGEVFFMLPETFEPWQRYASEDETDPWTTGGSCRPWPSGGGSPTRVERTGDLISFSNDDLNLVLPWNPLLKSHSPYPDDVLNWGFGETLNLDAIDFETMVTYGLTDALKLSLIHI